MNVRARPFALLFCGLATACGEERGGEGATMGSYVRSYGAPAADALTVCASGTTESGIDVSYWNGSIDWAQVAGAGVSFAFVRISDGLGYPDTRFTANWNGARAQNIRRGVYQFFRSDEDPVAQADYLLNTMGPLLPGDLPPVIDVETTDGQSAATIASNIGAWIERVEGALGVPPIVYTTPVFWDTYVASSAFASNPLWIAHWGVSCPSVPSPWTSWDLWQSSATGTVSGISGNVDLNKWNGEAATLASFAFTPSCGDSLCNGGERYADCPADCEPCQPVPAEGRIIDDTDQCFWAYGPSQYIRIVGGDGYGGGLKWTKSYVSAAPANYGIWELSFEEAGDYRVEVYGNDTYATWSEAPYQLRHDGVTDTVLFDPTADGWLTLGEFSFAAGGEQFLRIDDHVSDAADAGFQILFDAIRLTRIDTSEPDGGPVDDGGPLDDGGPMDDGGPGDEDATGDGDVTDDDVPAEDDDVIIGEPPPTVTTTGKKGRCAQLDPSVLAALLPLVRRRRRRASA